MAQRRLWLVPRVSVEEARSHLSAQPHRKSRLADLDLPFLELFWLPYWYSSFEVSKRSGADAGLPDSISTLVCALTNNGFAVDAHQVTADQQPEVQDCRTVEPSPVVSLEQATPTARGLVERFLGAGRRRSQIKQVSDQPTEVERWRYPVFALTYERKPGRLDIRVLDAITGQPSDPAVRRAVLAAVAAERA